MQNFKKTLQNLLISGQYKSKENLKKAVFLFISICISTLIFIFRRKFEHLGGYGYLGIFLLSILGNSTIIIPAPVFLTALIGGSVFNPLLVGVISALGATIGELTGYFAGYGSKVLVKEGKISKRIDQWMKKGGFLTIFVLAAIPNPFFDLAGITAGFINYPLKKFSLATFLGKTIKFVLIAVAGATLGQKL